jgi:hypothetical protein
MIIERHITKAISSAFLVLASAVTMPLPAWAGDAPECFDAHVFAQEYFQVPSVPGDCAAPAGQECIIMVWPWFIDLKVESVFAGRVPTRRLTVLDVRHSNTDTDKQYDLWLRRNNLGGFNILHAENKVPRCASDAKPVEAYIQPSAGQTLESLRADGARYFGITRTSH